jgi:hypothetical protein
VVIVGEEHYDDEGRELTVPKMAPFTPGDNLEVYNHHTGQLAFCVNLL